MAARRFLAAWIVAAVSAGSVLAACELFCATDCARAASVSAPASGCHGEAERRGTNGDRGCRGAHTVRVAVRDSGFAAAIAAAPAAFLASVPAIRPAAVARPALRALPSDFSSSSPPPILRV